MTTKAILGRAGGKQSEEAILIVSADATWRGELCLRAGVTSGGDGEARSGAEAIERLEQRPYSTVVLDPDLPDLDPEFVVRLVKGAHPATDVVLAERNGEVREAFVANNRITKAVLQKLAGNRAECPRESPRRLAESRSASVLPGIYGGSRAMQHVTHLLRLIAPRKTTVLLTGETGTGKELAARAIHDLSGRAALPLIIVNCAAIPETLMESELFGYFRGSFTGAEQSREGRIHAAQGGTIFLDEVGELPLSMQSKLLRFLQEGEVQRLGGSGTEHIDARVIAATNSNIAAAPESRPFRRDLYYRLAVFPIELPPLRQRGDDVVHLAEIFLADLCKAEGVAAKSFSEECLRCFYQHTWPGNVRELQHVVERAFILSKDEKLLTLEHLPAHLWSEN